MGWKGAMRAVGAAVRAAERDAKRRQRQLVAQQQQLARLEAADRAAHEVAVFENTLELLCSVHKECSDEIDWTANLDSPEPAKPRLSNKEERAERSKADSYRPSFVDRILKRTEKKQTKFRERVEQAAANDRAAYERAQADHAEALRDWNQLVDLSRRLLANDEAALLDAIKQLDPFSEIQNLGSEIQFSVGEGVPIQATVRVHGKEVIPKEVKTLLRSGKLSTKAMPVGRYNELHQDYVCSCALRVAREVFAILPVESVIVTANDELLNSKTGHLEEQPILSVLFVRRTLQALNFEKIDPSDSMQNFVHEMGFKKTTGLTAVTELDPAQFRVTSRA